MTTHEPARREVALDENGCIAEPVPCRGCGYILQGLAPDGTCPECSGSIERSIHGDLLRFCPPEWIGRMASGLLVIAISILVSGVFGIAVGGVAFAFAIGGGNVPLTVIVVAASVGGTVIGVFTVLGVWWLTAPDPGATETRVVNVRTLARWLMMAQLVALPLQMWATPGGGVGGTLSFASTGLVAAAGNFVASTTVALGSLCGLVHLRRIMLRIPRERLAGQLRVVVWGYGSAQAVGILLALVAVSMLPFTGGGTGGGPAGGGMVVGFLGLAVIGGLVGLATFGFGMWAIVLLFVCRVALLRVVSSVQAGWPTGR
jgi:hypothetical protein